MRSSAENSGKNSIRTNLQGIAPVKTKKTTWTTVDNTVKKDIWRNRP